MLVLTWSSVVMINLLPILSIQAQLWTSWSWSSSTDIEPDKPDCEWTDVASGVSFDLTELRIDSSTDQSYYWEANTDTSQPMLTFHFAWNICSPVTQASTPVKCLGRSAGGVVYVADDNWCNVMGSFNEKSLYSSFELLDKDDPSKGIILNYYNGDYCGASFEGIGAENDILAAAHDETRRSAQINIYCDNVATKVKYLNIPHTCAYNIVMESLHACPTDCEITSNGLCNAQGTCEYDKDARKAYCKCNTGYYGPDCAGIETSSYLSGIQDTVKSSIEYYYPSSSKATSHTFLDYMLLIALVCVLLVVGIVIGMNINKQLMKRRGYSQIQEVKAQIIDA